MTGWGSAKPCQSGPMQESCLVVKLELERGKPPHRALLFLQGCCQLIASMRCMPRLLREGRGKGKRDTTRSQDTHSPPHTGHHCCPDGAGRSSVGLTGSAACAYLHRDENLLEVTGKVLHLNNLLFQPVHVSVDFILSKQRIARR